MHSLQAALLLGESLLQVAQLVCASSRPVALPLLFLVSFTYPRAWLAGFPAYLLLGKEGPNESGQFKGLPGAILNCSLPILRNFPEGESISSPLDHLLFQLLGDILS